MPARGTSRDPEHPGDAVLGSPSQRTYPVPRCYRGHDLTALLGRRDVGHAQDADPQLTVLFPAHR